MLLTPEDLEALTHRRQPAAQIRELRRMGLRPIVRSDGTPVITWVAVNALMLGGSQNSELQSDLRHIAKRPQLNLATFTR